MHGRSVQFALRLLQWYDGARRDLPWRPPLGSAPHTPVDPYKVLISEMMLQQTQVATVIGYFQRFIAELPTLRALADANPQQVLKLWQGLGYYARVRHLQAAARAIILVHGGEFPRTAGELIELPGIGRYTAGAIASIAFDQPEPLVDGNVRRVLCRLDRIDGDVRERRVSQRLWSRAGQLLARSRPGEFNSAMMELGATVCTPRGPRCLDCPVRAHCEAYAAGVQDRIPAPRRAVPTPLLRRCVYCIERRGRWLIEQRADRGRWAGMWQFITVPQIRSGDARQRLATAERASGLKLDGLRRLGMFRHALTHRRYEFAVFAARAGETPDQSIHRRGTWVRWRDLSCYAMSGPHLRIAQMLADTADGG